MNNNLQPKTNEYFEIVACDENGKRSTFAHKQAETLEEVEKIIAEAYTYSDQMTDENRAYWDKQTYAVQKVVHTVTPYNEKLITKADQSVGFEREPGNAAEVKEFFDNSAFPVALVYGCCGHIACQGQYDQYGNMCPRCGRYETPVKHFRPESDVPCPGCGWPIKPGEAVVLNLGAGPAVRHAACVEVETKEQS